MATACAACSSSEKAKTRCNGCKEVTYCSKACQSSHFPTHSKVCPAFQKHNCFLLHADAQTSRPPLDHIAGQLEPFHLQQYGTETAEIGELKRRLGWSGASEVGKFYDHAGSDTWYYFVYGQHGGKAKGKAKNEVANMVCGETHGDVAIIRSGPAGFDTPETFTKSALVNALKFYKTLSRDAVFSERERNRFAKRTGFDLSGVQTFDATNWKFGH
ncbi:MAG: hypothetical protein LQ344_002612 [Seirophora lacunosa]|nr:MAG: hypothetical protein LQ344_002612 [Seirophora lacunosa]